MKALGGPLSTYTSTHVGVNIYNAEKNVYDFKNRIWGYVLGCQPAPSSKFARKLPIKETAWAGIVLLQVTSGVLTGRCDLAGVLGGKRIGRMLLTKAGVLGGEGYARILIYKYAARNLGIFTV